MHNKSRKQIDRLQRLNKEGEDFKIKKKGNNKLSFDIYDELYLYLKNYFHEHVQPSPEGKDQHLLPLTFSLRDVHKNFVKTIRLRYQKQDDPRCLNSFIKFYKYKFPYLRKLERSDFCDTCSKYKQALAKKGPVDTIKEAKRMLDKHEELFINARKAYTHRRLQTPKEMVNSFYRWTTLKTYSYLTN